MSQKFRKKNLPKFYVVPLLVIWNWATVPKNDQNISKIKFYYKIGGVFDNKIQILGYIC